VKDLERQVAQLYKILPSPALDTVTQVEAGNPKFSAKGLQSLRKRLGLSAKECGAFVGVTGWTIGNWERGKARPRGEQIAAVAEIRRIGKREAQKDAKKLAQK
jgi:DNA-binding transcriptional regulator YiaG